VSKIQVSLNIFLLFIVVFLFLKLQLIGALGFGQTPLLDFDTYFQISRDVLKGLHPYELPYMQTMGPPLVIFPFIPFGFLPLQLGRVIIIWFGLLFSLIACKMLTQKTTLAITLFIFLLTSFPARFTLAMGQPNLIILLLITYLLTKKDELKKGVFLAILVTFKTFFLFSSLALIKRHIGTIKFAFITGLVITVSSLWILKPQYYYDYVTKKLAPITLTINRPANLDYYNQSLRSTLTRFGLEQYYLFIFLAALIGSSFYLILSGDFKSGILLSILLSPVIWQHYLVMIFPIIVLIGIQLIKEQKIALLLLYLFGVLCWWIELPWLQTASHTLVNQTLASHYFISLVIFAYLSVKLFRSL
jgi:hypothetical protein